MPKSIGRLQVSPRKSMAMGKAPYKKGAPVEGSSEDVKEDAKLAKKMGIPKDKWESSAADKMHDAGKLHLKKGGGVCKKEGGTVKKEVAGGKKKAAPSALALLLVGKPKKKK